MTLSRGKKVVFTCIVVAFVLLMVEMGVRLLFAVQVGPSVLLYGLRSARQELDRQETNRSVWHPDHKGGRYTKFRPNQMRFDKDPETQSPFTVTINSRGFRGSEFSDQKKPGVVRVITLGESSTFGFYARDEETYPHYLEQLLNAGCVGRAFEVINFGIPHLRSNHVLALFLAEALPLQPDVVTYYQGINDNLPLEHDAPATPPTRIGVLWPVRSAYGSARNHILSVALFHDLLTGSVKREEYSDTQVRAHAEAIGRPFLENVSRIHRESRQRGIVFIGATQQAASLIVKDHKDLRGLTYEGEVGLVMQKLAREGSVTRRERDLYAHSLLMRDLRHWATTNEIPLVDIIKILDQERDVLWNWVHLSRRGNQVIAASFAREILSQTCRAGAQHKG
jgi:lysophospholipase L1-like esterase